MHRRVTGLLTGGLLFILAMYCCSAAGLPAPVSAPGPETLRLYQTAPDTTRSMMLEQMALHYRETRPDTALELARQGLELAIRHRYRRGIAYNQFRIASILRFMGRETESYPLIEKTLPVALALKDSLLISKVYYALGVHSDNSGKPHRSVSFFTKSLTYSRAAHQYAQAAHAAMGVATLQQKLGNVPKAEQYLLESKQLADLSGDSSLIGMALFNLGDLQEQNGNYQMALKTYLQAFPMLDTQGTAEQQSFVRHGLARTYEHLHKPAQARTYYQQLAAFHHTPSILARDEATHGYLGLARLAEQQGKYQEALHHWQTATALKDSIAAVRKREMVLQMQASIESQRKQKQIKQLRTEKARQDKEMNLMSTLLAGACILLVCLFIIIRLRKQHTRLLNEKNKELSRQNEEITTLYEQMAIQASFLSDMNEEVTQVNQELEEKILRRTQALENQNTILKQYAFLNAHQLRSPIANLLGLGNLLSMSESTEEKEYIYLLISQQIVKLDQAIQEAQKYLNQAEYCVQCEEARKNEQVNS